MPSHLDRVRVWLEQGRVDLAEPELRQMVARDPHDPQARVLWAACLLEMNRVDEGMTQARDAVGLAPDMPFAHGLIASAHAMRGELPEARAAIQRAIQLDPDDSHLHGRLAAIFMAAGRWREGLEAAERGLRIDATDPLCTDMRTRALAKLGRTEDAAAASAEGLRQRPEDSSSHAAHGWTCLQQGHSKQAVEAFAQALRLDPHNPDARAGLVVALKARHLLYRVLLSFVFWVQTLSGKHRLVLFVGVYVLVRLVGAAGKVSPMAHQAATVLLSIYLLFVLLTWLGDAAFNLLLLLSRYGRLAMDLSDKATGAALGVLALLGVAAGAVGLALDVPWLIHLAVVSLLLTIPVTNALSLLDDPRGRLRLWAAGVLAVVGLVGVAMRAWLDPPQANVASTVFVVGLIVYMWACAAGVVLGRRV
ncbi:MAG: tetratricopeptide repeat protein [Phycisphaeraceae bacterium]|nr:tetratricopeptide repeat protein [Phycisphaeraceae bacterium]